MAKAPYDNAGRFVPRDCPNPLCGAGRLQWNNFYHVWECDGLADPEDDGKELQCCKFVHVDGQPYTGAQP